MKKQSKIILGFSSLLLLPLLFMAAYELWFAASASHDDRLRRVVNGFIARDMDYSLLHGGYLRQWAGLSDNGLLAKTNNPDGCEWNVRVHLSGTTADLPLEGLTTAELTDRAQTNADACLLLACERRLTLHATMKQRRQWLARAAELGRPGAQFLLDYARHREAGLSDAQQQRLLEYPIFPTNVRHMPQPPADLGGLEGYADFRTRVLAGDFLLFRTLAYLEPGVLDHPLGREYMDQLEQEGRQGSFTAMQRHAECLTLPASRFAKIRATYDEMNHIGLRADGSTSFWEKLTTDFSGLPVRKQNRQANDDLYRASLQGNLSANNLWLSLPVDWQSRFDSDRWQHQFAAQDLLIERGYAAHMENLASILLSTDYNVYEKVIGSFTASMASVRYKGDDIDRVVKDLQRDLRQRGSRKQVFLDLVMVEDLHTEAEQLELLERIDRLDPCLLVYGNRFYPLILQMAASPAVTGKMVGIIERLADEGDPHAQLTLADILTNGRYEPADLRRARELLERAWEGCERYNSLYVTYANESESEIMLRRLVFEHLMDLYLSDGEGVGDHARAASFAQDYKSYAARQPGGLTDPNYYFFLGVLHERGIGMPEHIDQAVLMYKAARNDSMCPRADAALASLYERGKGVERNLDEALYLYDMAERSGNGFGDYAEDVQRVSSLIELEKQQKTGPESAAESSP